MLCSAHKSVEERVGVWNVDDYMYVSQACQQRCETRMHSSTEILSDWRHEKMSSDFNGLHTQFFDDLSMQVAHSHLV